MSEITDSPNYIGMGILSVPSVIREALYNWEDTRQQAKRQYGYHRENMMIDADNKLVLAIEAYVAEVTEQTAMSLLQGDDSERLPLA